MPANDPLAKLLTPKQCIALVVAIFVIACVIGIIQARRQQPEPGPEPGPAPQQPGEQPRTLANRNVRFGMPAEAKADPASRDAFLLDRPQYVLSYNDSKKISNWVCWNLTATDIGKTERGKFTEDPDLPQGFRRVTSGMYTASGFDRGHMCPSKDRSDTEANNDVVFYMTNILPQAPNNNQKGWRLLEEHCRSLAKKGNELYIASGPYGQGGTGTAGPKETIGSSVKITVPESVWKVVLVLPGKEEMPTQTTQAIAVWMPNDQSVTENWRAYTVSVAEVEKRTGYKFFPLVPDDIAAPIKGRADHGP